MIRVVLADDEAMIRAGVRTILASDADIEVVAEAGDGRAAIEAARRHRPDVVLLDIRMPGLDGLSAAAELRETMPGTAVVVLTTFDEDVYVAEALEHGVSGFLLKASDPRELLIGVHAVAEGAAYLSPRIARRVITHVRGGGLSRPAMARRRVAELTPRERDVLAALGTGLSNADIGRALSLSEGTVKAHVSAILRRLGLDNRVQAAILAYEAGLVVRDT
ncbi:response regulator [Saccharomonospora cyanea]|uniref:Response regulator containing a CheY-like receiver domain and an HTH DNA-binding domain n=1 Tax=Saccharomonospora cyanea NA-134 TaxID=882082 RepID=H5XLY0_9PSEU|nr:response regulator transcription factor [Saccharomonospora cyanea]EHR62022.1 response regulator containing a CheY-like receiver domain and an HTH DNA-binding domain [Saccharomonospora cyanea NA-134]